ncbi:MAG: indolepyruvate oxidoreductase subunit beta [Thermodesulfobacteriota bacterium]|nr:indolepyruvate oxidoreductase subunit beta [Thermodesulfobacteriota bacterium]
MKAESRDPLNLIITGVGGQGNVLISQVMGLALVNKGFKVAVGETFGLSQRGGSVQSHIRISRDKVYGPLIPEGQAHAVLGLEPMETLRVVPVYGRPGLKIVVNSRPVPPLNVIAGEAVYPSEANLKSALNSFAAKVWWVNGTATAQKLGAAIMANIVLLGALAATGLIPLDKADLEDALGRVLPPDRLQQNITAFRRGARLIR